MDDVVHLSGLVVIHPDNSRDGIAVQRGQWAQSRTHTFPHNRGFRSTNPGGLSRQGIIQFFVKHDL